MSSTSEMLPVDTTSFFQGTVKWFNNKAGYGFLTITQDSVSKLHDFPNDQQTFVGRDIFVHHSVIRVQESVFRYLVPGELVIFRITVPEDGRHQYQSDDVTAFSGRRFKCETNQSRRRRNEQVDEVAPHVESWPEAPAAEQTPRPLEEIKESSHENLSEAADEAI